MKSNLRRGRLAWMGASLALVAAGVAVPASSAKSSIGSAASSGKHVSVALVLPLTDNLFMNEVAEGSKQAGKNMNASVEVTGPPATNPTQEVTDLNQVVTKAPDGISVMPQSAALFTHALSQAAGATKVDVLSILATQGAKGSGTYVGLNTTQAEQAELKVIVGKLPHTTTGTVVVSNCFPGSAALDTRAHAAIAYLKQSLPHAKVVGPITSGTSPQAALSAWESAYNANTNVVALVGNCDVDGPALAQLQHIDPGKYLTAGWDLDPGTLQGLKSGHLTVTINEEPFLTGYLASALLIHAAQTGAAVPSGFLQIRPVIVTQATVGQAIAQEKSGASLAARYDSIATAFLSNEHAKGGVVTLEPIADAYKGSVN